MSIWDVAKKAVQYGTPAGWVYTGGKWIYDKAKGAAKDTFSQDTVDPYDPNSEAFQYGYSPEESHAVKGTKKPVYGPDGKVLFYTPWSEDREVTKPGRTFEDELNRQQRGQDSSALSAMRAAQQGDYYGLRENTYNNRALDTLTYDQYGSRNSQQSAYDRLMALSNEGPGNSAALAQLQAGQDAAMQQSLALARSGRGAGASAASTRNAIFQNSALNAQTNQQAAVLRAQEEAAYRQRQGELVNNAGALATNIRANDVNVGQTYGQLGYSQGQLRNAAEQRAQQSEQQAFNYEQMRQQILAQQNANQMELEKLKSVNNMSAQGTNVQLDMANDQKVTGLLGAAIGAAGTAMTKSDRRAKTDIVPLDEASAEEAIREAPGYSYRYKDPDSPGAAPGRQVGPMAQDLERTPAGRSVVSTGPDGAKAVDTGRLALVNTAALSAQQKKIDRLMAELDALQASATVPSREAEQQAEHADMIAPVGGYTPGGSLSPSDDEGRRIDEYQRRASIEALRLHDRNAPAQEAALLADARARPNAWDKLTYIPIGRGRR